MATSRSIHFASLAVAWAAALSMSASAARYFVDASGSDGDGLSWTNAKTNPQDAIDIAESGDEIWVAVKAGGYTPTHETSADPRSATFLIGEDQDGIKIYGGFLGLAYGGGGESSFGQRDPEVNITS